LANFYEHLPGIYSLNPKKLRELREAELIGIGSRWFVVFLDMSGPTARCEIGNSEPSLTKLNRMLRGVGLTAEHWTEIERHAGGQSRLTLIGIATEIAESRLTELTWGKWLSFAAGVLCLIAITTMPYAFYSSFRVTVTGAAIALCILSVRRRAPMWMLGLIPISLLLNPIIPIELDKETWAILDLTMAAYFGALFAHYDALIAIVRRHGEAGPFA